MMFLPFPPKIAGFAFGLRPDTPPQAYAYHEMESFDVIALTMQTVQTGPVRCLANQPDRCGPGPRRRPRRRNSNGRVRAPVRRFSQFHEDVAYGRVVGAGNPERERLSGRLVS